MLSAAGRALVARAAAGGPVTAPTCLASSSTGLAAAAAASLLCRWQRGLAASAASAAAEAPPEGPAASAPAAPAPPSESAATPPPPPPQQQDQGEDAGATAAAAPKTGPRVIQPLSRLPPSGGSGGRGPRHASGGMMSRSLTGTVHVSSTPNNTLLTLLSREGMVKALVTAGSVGFRNSGKGTPQAAERAAAELARRALGMGIGSVAVRFRGTGRNKQYAVSALAAGGLSVTSLEDVTPVAYNGCRLPRRRRV
jgi:small subunit ribosomal protein S11